MQEIQYLVSLQWPVVQLDFSDGMHMTEKSYMPQSARMRAQIQANTGNFAGQRFSLHGVDLTKFDGGGARDQEDHPWTAPGELAQSSRHAPLLNSSPTYVRTMYFRAHARAPRHI